jgi:glycosyltransferase involved in cell wall biosynthesis
MSIGAAMILKNEVGNVPRLVASLEGKLDYYTVLDSGSTDGTQEAIEREFANIGVDGEVIQVEWQWFGKTRTLAMQAARTAGTDWILMIDGDEEVVGEIDLEIPPECNAIGSEVRHGGGVSSWKPRLTRSKDEWEWVGRTHEDFVLPGQKAVIYPSTSFYIDHHYDTSQTPLKLARDLVLLQQDVEDDPYNTRAIYYLAFAHAAMGNFTEALRWYRVRASFRGDTQEYQNTLTGIGTCLMALEGR